jgi:DNA-directed RNA polymerase subunit omega
MNPEYLRKAREKVGNPNILINLISRRVRQLNCPAGGTSQALVADAENLRAVDIALREVIEEKMGWEMAEVVALIRPTSRKIKRQGTAIKISA